jgi:hypothetical protein
MAGAYMILIGAIALIAFSVLRKTRRSKRLENRIASLPNFSPALRYQRPESGSVLLLDPANEQFALVDLKAIPRVYGFSQLVAVEIDRNGVALDKVNRGSAVMGAAVGGALLGPAGLLLGGLMGSKRKEELVRRLALRLYTNDLHAPFVDAVFFDHKDGLKPTEKEVAQAAVQLEEWYGRFLTILNGVRQVAAPDEIAVAVPTPATAGGFGRRRALASGH